MTPEQGARSKPRALLGAALTPQTKILPPKGKKSSLELGKLPLAGMSPCLSVGL